MKKLKLVLGFAVIVAVMALNVNVLSADGEFSFNITENLAFAQATGEDPKPCWENIIPGGNFYNVIWCEDGVNCTYWDDAIDVSELNDCVDNPIIVGPY
ncbi:hypothetical protein BXY85_1319 [Roseivirga pacifica]|uniref:Uncharacterized protein n=1 Tax=Roseivirga pacifica TaxID=1267423 RepID=A0A1I0MCY2_9BACT|nr:hypothetical protein [Roseivirga pacifica]RKQ50305.1 hypothetical protein BXY85_1319 [Roseivirga pacifica]SEV86365.1 hypothetical protein SAMN05216290_0303 [Roseivirga pacifica]